MSPLAGVLRPLLADDPLLNLHIGWAVLLIVVIKVLLAFGVLLVSVMLMIWFERKLISDMQSRIGPNRAGPWGLFQTLADGIKLFFKEDLVPGQADSFVFKLAPYLTLIPALLIFTVIPIGGVLDIDGYPVALQVADPPIGILLVLAMSSIAVYGIMLAGWSSGSKYPLLGSVRASAQMISYEAALGMTVVTVILVTGSLRTRAIVDAQASNFWDWNVLRLGVVPFLIFLIAVTAELNRPPFDLVEADSELVGGFNTEYSSIRLALFYLAEFMNTITMSAVMVTLFFGGPDGPIPHFIPTSDIWMPIIWFLVKTFAFLFLYVWLRAALPRLRYDQLMDLGWKVLIPLSLAWMLVVASILVWHWYGLLVAAAMVLAGAVLARAFTVGGWRQQEDAILPPVGPRVAPPRLVGLAPEGLEAAGPDPETESQPAGSDPGSPGGAR